MSTTATAPILPQTTASPKRLQGSYSLADGSVRNIYAQRVLGHVRLTDEPEHPGKGARAYLLERAIETDPVADGTSAAAHLNSIVNDYLDQARRLRRCPLEREALLTDAPATHMLAPKAERTSPFDLMLKYNVTCWEDAIAARAAARREAKALAEAQAQAEADAQAEAELEAVAA
jgi:hypothetical protein